MKTNNLTATLKTELSKERENLQRQVAGVQKRLENIEAKLELLTQIEARTRPKTKAANPVARAASNPNSHPANPKKSQSKNS